MTIIGHGVDLVPVDRIAAILRDHPERFLERTFTAREQLDSAGPRQAQRLASRFAAKEAVLKAMGTGLTRGMTLLEVGVVPLPSGQPTVQLTGKAAEVAHSMGIKQFLISLTDTDGYSMASAIAVGE
jgi:holo-[acyl-carrier protein] synthase